MRSSSYAGAALVGVTALLGGVAACSGDSGPQVRTATVALGNVDEVVEAPASVQARASATVTAPADGTIEVLTVRDGQRVRQGQVVLRIDSPSAQAQLRQARQADAEVASAGRVDVPSVDISAQQAQVDAAAQAGFGAAREAAARIPSPALRAQALAGIQRAEAQYAAARAEAEATVAQFNAGVASLADALGSLSTAQRVQTRAALAVAQRAVDALTVTAPISGTASFGAAAGGGGSGGAGQDLGVLLGQLPAESQGQAQQLLGGGAGGSSGATAVNLSEGAPVRSGQTLLTITDVSTLSLAAEVDETDVLLVRPGVRADVELDAVPGASYAATVTSVDVSPTPSSRGGVSYRVRLALGGGTTVEGDPAPAPRPGMSAVADLRVRSARGVVAVPSSALVRDGLRDTVFVVDAGRAHRRTVELGAQGDTTVQVVSGVRAGERVVVSGADRLRDGEELPR